MNRFVVVSGDEQAPKASVRQPSKEAWERIASPLRAIRDRAENSPRHMEMQPEAEEVWKEFYTAWRNERKAWHPKHAQLTCQDVRACPKNQHGLFRIGRRRTDERRVTLSSHCRWGLAAIKHAAAIQRYGIRSPWQGRARNRRRFESQEEDDVSPRSSTGGR